MTAPQLAPSTPPTAAERIGALLRRERNASRLSQQRLADRLGIHQASLARWELGRSCPTLAQIDDALGFLGLRLRLDVEPTPDPGRPWELEALRLASLTPAQRLGDYDNDNDLANLVAGAQHLGVTGAVDGQTAARLQGVPGVPRWMEIVTTPDQVLGWLTLQWVSQGPVESNREASRVTKAEAADDFIRDGLGHVKTVYGYLRLRVLDAVPASVELCLQEASEEGERVVAPVVQLSALAAHWRQQTP